MDLDPLDINSRDYTKTYSRVGLTWIGTGLDVMRSGEVNESTRLHVGMRVLHCTQQPSSQPTAGLRSKNSQSAINHE